LGRRKTLTSKSDYLAANRSPVFRRTAQQPWARKRTRSLNLTKLFLRLWSAPRLGAASFSEIDSLGFLFPPNMNQHDAFFDARRRLSNLSHPFQPFEHLAVNSVNEIA
jgi:hypothetical protein